nr:hypothetical protein GCM10025730_51540 [Promicromonospora thailandica]
MAAQEREGERSVGGEDAVEEGVHAGTFLVRAALPGPKVLVGEKRERPPRGEAVVDV